MSETILYYSGWCVLSPNTKFQYVGQDQSKSIIFLEDYNQLTEEEQEEYILENAAKAILESSDGSWEELNITQEEN